MKLEFGPARNKMVGSQARVTFPNGYGVSVITGGIATSVHGGYELAVTHHDELCYDTPITDDVELDLTLEEAEAMADEVAALPPAD
jgi:hypothetical protein